jgi:hypothetical protein
VSLAAILSSRLGGIYLVVRLVHIQKACRNSIAISFNPDIGDFVKLLWKFRNGILRLGFLIGRDIS